MSEQQTGRRTVAFRPRVWWSPTAGVVEQVPPRSPDEQPCYVRTNDAMRRLIDVPDDAVELVPATNLGGE